MTDQKYSYLDFTFASRNIEYRIKVGNLYPMRCVKCSTPTKYNVCQRCASIEEKEALDNLDRLDQLILDRQLEIKRIGRLKWNMPTKLLVGIVIGSVGIVLVYGFSDLTTVWGALLVVIGFFVGLAGWIESFPNNMVNADIIDELRNSIRDLKDEKMQIIGKHWRNKHV